MRPAQAKGPPHKTMHDFAKLSDIGLKPALQRARAN